jgi:hypothetical protein
VPVGVEREHRRERRAAEAQLDVRVVLEHDEVVLARELQEPVALLAGERVPGRVLEVGDDVRELGPQAALEQLGERVHVDAVGLEVHRHDVRPALAQPEQRAVVGRALDDDGVVRLDERVEQERVRLHRAVRDDDLRRVDAVLLRDPRTQRHVADRRAVGGGACGVLLEGLLRRLTQPLEVDDVRGRRSAREGDEVGGGHGLEATH